MGVIAGSLMLGLGVLTVAHNAKAEAPVAQARRTNMAHADNERIVTDFCNAWSRLDADELADYFTPDGIWHNMPLEPIQGREVLRERLKITRQRIKQIRIEILHQVSSGNVVMNERIDYIVRESGEVAVPVMGIFEMENGKIKAWREYFYLNVAQGKPSAPSR
jgi:limonene-1,2-epoxide hydrolase